MGAVSGNDSTQPLDTGHRNVSTVGLLLIAFFWCSGGIYGNESLLEAAPSGYVFVALIVGAVFYAIPMALVSAELSCALPYDGGVVAWVEEACGPRIGAHNMYWLWISYLFDACAYPVFAAEYFQERFNLTDAETDLVADGIVLCITLIKLGGTDYIVKASGTLFVVSMLPATIYIVYGTKELRAREWTDTDVTEDAGGLDEAMLLSWIIWLFSGFSSLGALAGEIKEPSKSYPIVIVILVPLVTLFIVMPLMVSLSIDSSRENYEPGHFDTLATQLCGDWLGILFVAGATCCFIGLYNAQIIVCERSVAAFLAPKAGHLADHHPKSRVLGYLLKENGTGVAPIFILFNSALSMVLVWLPYDALVEFSIIINCLNVLLYMYAYMWYRVTQPDIHRPFNVIPWGVTGGFLAVLPLIAMSVVTFYYACVSGDEVLGLKDAKILGAVILIAAGGCANLLYLGYLKLHRWCTGGVDRVAASPTVYQYAENKALLVPSSTTADGPTAYGSVKGTAGESVA